MRAFVTFLVLAVLIGWFVPASAQDWTGRGRVRGTVLDPDGDPVTITWEQTSGPTASIANQNAASTSVTAESGKPR